MDKIVSESGKQRQNTCIQNSKGGAVLTLKIPFKSSSKKKTEADMPCFRQDLPINFLKISYFLVVVCQIRVLMNFVLDKH